MVDFLSKSAEMGMSFQDALSFWAKLFLVLELKFSHLPDYFLMGAWKSVLKFSRKEQKRDSIVGGHVKSVYQIQYMIYHRSSGITSKNRFYSGGRQSVLSEITN